MNAMLTGRLAADEMSQRTGVSAMFALVGAKVGFRWWWGF
jgi:hypothetical protein